MKENATLPKIRLKASRKGIYLWRNNNGAVHTAEGNFIRFGLANDSKVINDRLKSSDLIGIKPVTITLDMVGKILGVFMSREVKRPGWKFTGTSRENAQLNWINLINSLGGDAAFITNEDEL